VKKVIVIFLTSLYLLGATEAYQLMKLPYLFKHYQTHQQIDNGLSFSKFIDMHYFDNQTYDSDYQQDMQLPFKSSNRTVSLLNFVTLFSSKQAYTAAIFFETNQKFRIFDEGQYVSMNYRNIFQPPRIVLS
jgi:hypothetical protein